VAESAEVNSQDWAFAKAHMSTTCNFFGIVVAGRVLLQRMTLGDGDIDVSFLSLSYFSPIDESPLEMMERLWLIA
jgi:hypothetical protein